MDAVPRGGPAPTRLALLCFAFVCSQLGCGIHYTRAKRSELITTEQGVEIAHRLDTNEILATDTSGLVCSGVSTQLSAYSNAQGAINKMEREGTYRETFTYQRFSPAQFAGLQCGAYYRWSSGTNAIYDESGAERPRDVWGRTSTKEFGFHAEGSEQLYKDLFGTVRFRFGGGKSYDEGGTFLVEGTRVIFPLDIGLMYAPAFLYGAGVKVFGGYDVLNLVTDAGSKSEKFNYGATGFYRASVGRIGFGVEGGWRHESVATYDPGTWIEADDRFGMLWGLYDF